MIGPVLNLLNSLYKSSEELSNVEPYDSSSDIFGNGTLDITISQNTDLKTLYNQYHTLEFHNVTINEGVSLKPTPAFGGDHNWQSFLTEFHPLYLKCSGTLTVNGELTSRGCGGRSDFYNGDATCYQPVSSPVPLINYNNGTGGQSADPTNFVRLMEYGKNGAFFKFNDLLLCGAGGGGHHRYRRGGVHSGAHHRHYYVYMRGFANGGDEDRPNCVMGCAGGFVALYYSDLVINGIPYGTAGCDITKVSANGYRDASGDTNRRGGGCIIASARVINIGANGSINSDGEGGCEYTVASKLGRTYRAGKNRGSSNFKPSFLNNIPAMSGSQRSFRWDENTQSYITNNGDGLYYFDDGSGYGVPTNFVTYDNSIHCGGAGVVLGYRISNKKQQSINIVPTKEVRYYGWRGYHTPYYAWVNTTYAPGNNTIAYTLTEVPEPGTFLIGTVPSGFTGQITGVGENTITLITNLGVSYTFTRNIVYDSGPSAENSFIIYTKSTAPSAGAKTYDAPKNTTTGYVSTAQKINNNVYISDGIRWFARYSAVDQTVLE